MVATKLLPIGKNCCACHPISPALRIACAVNFPVDTFKKTLALVLASDTTWESTVGDVTSYGGRSHDFGLGVEPRQLSLEASKIFPPVVVVLVEHRDRAAGSMLDTNLA
jgi:hypothetical protein